MEYRVSTHNETFDKDGLRRIDITETVIEGDRNEVMSVLLYTFEPDEIKSLMGLHIKMEEK